MDIVAWGALHRHGGVYLDTLKSDSTTVYIIIIIKYVIKLFKSSLSTHREVSYCFL